MQDKDLFFSSDDLGEIFGGAVKKPEAPPAPKSAESKAAPAQKTAAPAPAEKAAPVKEAVKEQPVSKLITHSKTDEFRIVEQLSASAPKAATADKSANDAGKVKTAVSVKESDLSAVAPPGAEADVDDLIRRAREIEERLKKESASAPTTADKQMASVDEATIASVAPASPGMVPGTMGEKVASELVNLNEELRKAIYSDLSLKLPEKSVLNMMSKTLEKAALNYLVLRNTNWDRGGNLKNDGSIDIERFLVNIAKYRDQIPEMEREVGMALSALLFMRLRSVKLGLGAQAYADMKDRIRKKLNVLGAGYGKEASKIMTDSVMAEAFKKGDEEK